MVVRDIQESQKGIACVTCIDVHHLHGLHGLHRQECGAGRTDAGAGSSSCHKVALGHEDGRLLEDRIEARWV